VSLATDHAIVRFAQRCALRARTTDPDDLAAEGLLAVIQAEAKGWPPGVKPAAAAVMTIRQAIGNKVRSQAKDHARKLARLRDAGREWSRPSAPIDAADEVDHLTAGIAPPKRRALYLRYALDYTWPEVGRELGVSERTAKWFGDRALELARRQIP
jgi:RNA polymerase sigma factor (sigma-70 family)